MTGKIHSIESFGTVDGPGLRFVVFFQGCPLRCQYCHNPDTWEVNAGKEMTVDEILKEFEKNISFYKDGGITVTGGEPLLQIDFLTELFEKAHEKNIHTCIDTSGITFNKKNPDVIKKFDRLMAVTDLVMLDIKHINTKEHKTLTGKSNDRVFDFCEYLESYHIPLWVRHVLIPGITNNETYLRQLGDYIGGLTNVKALDVLPYHTMGENKYKEMGLEYPLAGVPAMDKADAVKAQKIILENFKIRRAQLLKEIKEQTSTGSEA